MSLIPLPDLSLPVHPFSILTLTVALENCPLYPRALPLKHLVCAVPFPGSLPVCTPCYIHYVLVCFQVASQTLGLYGTIPSAAFSFDPLLHSVMFLHAICVIPFHAG